MAAVAALRYLPTPIFPPEDAALFATPPVRTRLPVQVSWSSLWPSLELEPFEGSGPAPVCASSSARFWLRNSSNGSTKIVTLMIRIGVMGLLVESTGEISRAFKVVDDGEGSSIRRANMVCLRFRWGRAR